MIIAIIRKKIWKKIGGDGGGRDFCGAFKIFNCISIFLSKRFFVLFCFVFLLLFVELLISSLTLW